MKITNIGVKVHFWPDFKKVKKWILLDIFSRKGPMTLKMCGKKTYDPSGFSPEIFFYLNKNWQKYWQLESCHFFFDHTVGFFLIYCLYSLFQKSQRQTKIVLDQKWVVLFEYEVHFAIRAKLSLNAPFFHSFVKNKIFWKKAHLKPR